LGRNKRVKVQNLKGEERRKRRGRERMRK